MVFADFDGTIRPGNAAYEFAAISGKGRKAKELYFTINSKTKEIVKEEKNQSHLIKRLDALYESLLKLGASLLQDVPTTRISEIPYQPTPKLLDIVATAEKEGALDIGTLDHEGFVEKFIEVNKEKLPSCCKIVSCSKLGEANGFFNGEIERYSGIEAKMHNYRSGSVYANSLSDIGVCVKANESKSNCKIYVVDNPESILNENALLEEFLEENGIPFLKA